MHAATSAPDPTRPHHSSNSCLSVAADCWLAGHGAHQEQPQQPDTLRAIGSGDVAGTAASSRRPLRTNLAGARHARPVRRDPATATATPRLPRQVDDTNSHGFTLDRERHHLF